MSLQIYYPDDIRNALQAAEIAIAFAPIGDGEFAAGYMAGHTAAILTMASAFGIQVVKEVQDMNGNKRTIRLLDLGEENAR